MLEREGNQASEDIQIQVVRRFLGKQAESRARESLFRSFTFYSYIYLLYADGWAFAGGLPHHHYHHSNHSCVTSDLGARSWQRQR